MLYVYTTFIALFRSSELKNNGSVDPLLLLALLIIGFHRAFLFLFFFFFFLFSRLSLFVPVQRACGAPFALLQRRPKITSTKNTSKCKSTSIPVHVICILDLCSHCRLLILFQLHFSLSVSLLAFPDHLSQVCLTLKVMPM